MWYKCQRYGLMKEWWGLIKSLGDLEIKGDFWDDKKSKKV